MNFEIIPAIDLKNNKCVQLIGGDPNRKAFESDDPIQIAQGWIKKGAKRLHVIDLDGAISNKRINEDIVLKIAHISTVPIQYGGGVRTLSDAKYFFSNNIDKLIVGTAAIDSKELIKELIDLYSSKKLIIAADTKLGYVMIEGWQKKSDKKAIEFINEFEEIGVSQFLFTNIDKEGQMKGIDEGVISEIVDHTDSYIAIAGGISSIEDVKLIAQKGANAVVIGSALYNGKISLREAIDYSNNI